MSDETAVGGEQMTEEEAAEAERERLAQERAEIDRQQAALQRDGYVEIGLCYYYPRGPDGDNRLVGETPVSRFRNRLLYLTITLPQIYLISLDYLTISYTT